MLVRTDLLRGGTLTEASHVRVLACIIAAPAMVSVRNLGDVVVIQLAMHAIDQRAHLARR